MLIIKKGDSRTLNFVVTSGSQDDQTKLTQAELDSAIDIRFVVKNKQTDLDSAALIDKSIGSGITTLPDGAAEDPNLKVEILSTDTSNLLIKEFFIGLQVKFSSTENQEANIFEEDDSEVFHERLRIIQDTVSA